MNNAGLIPGSRVQTIMGVRLVGSVVEPKSASILSVFTDGQYRQPHGMEKREAVYVQWEDNTFGWIHRAMLKILK